MSRVIKIAIFSVALFVSCSQGSYQSNSRKLNLAAMYYPLATTIHPVYKVYHNSDNTSLLFIKIFTSELMFIPSNIQGESVGKVDVSYTLYETVNDTTMQVADSGTFNYSIDEDIVGKRFFTQIPFKAELGKTYQLKVFTEDKLRKAIDIKYLDVNKLDATNSQNYNLTNHSDIPYFTNVVKPEALFRIKNRSNPQGKIYIKYFKHTFEAPRPTYTYRISDYFEQQEDSLWIFDYTFNLTMQLAYEGYYLISVDTTQKGGILISNYGESYPKVTSAEEMVQPLQYIALKKEYDLIINRRNTKLAIDNFWIEKGNGLARGRELIRIFYNRVYFSNYYFTSGLPGWASDRGMVYVMYGPPQKLERTPNGETWYYWVKKDLDPVKFVFNYSPDPYFSNNYVLSRADNHSWHWQDALVSWRNGKIFLQD